MSGGRTDTASYGAWQRRPRVPARRRGRRNPAPGHHDARRCPPGGAVERQLLEQRAALVVAQSPGRPAVEVEEVEDLENRRVPVARRAREAPAKQGEVGAAVSIQAHQLAVEGRAVLAERRRHLRELREVRRAFSPVTRAQGDRPAVVAQLRTAAIPFQLKRPHLAVRHLPGREQHRRHERGLRFTDRQEQAA